MDRGVKPAGLCDNGGAHDLAHSGSADRNVGPQYVQFGTDELDMFEHASPATPLDPAAPAPDDLPQFAVRRLRPIFHEPADERRRDTGSSRDLSLARLYSLRHG